MLIYSHSTPEKLAPVAYNKEFITNNTDFCGLVDDGDIGIDVEIAIQYKAALTGDPDAARLFITSIFLSGYALDAHTLDWYVTRVQNNPVLFPYIGEVERNSFNFDYRDCLNSPCNYFNPTSPNIGSIGDTAASLNYNTIPTLTGFDGIRGAFSMAMASLNKIPVSIQECVGEVTQLTTDIFKNTMDIFNEDEETKKKQQDAIESGNSYRSTSIGDVYTSDYRNYLDVSTAASDLLGSIASTMGNCFKLFQYQHRYNPFDYRMNQQVANKSGIQHKIGDVWTAMGYNGTNLYHEGNYATATTSYTTSPTPNRGSDVQLRGTLQGTTIKMYATIFGGYYDEANKTLYRDASDKGPWVKETQNGIGHRSNKYTYTPSIERAFINKWNEGYRYPNNSSTPQTGVFNRGFAISKEAVHNYFDLVNENVSKSDINTSIANSTLQARIKFNGKTFLLPIIDTKGEASRMHLGTSYRIIDITADTLSDLYNVDLSIVSERPGSIDPNIIETFKNYTDYENVSSPIAEVQFIIPGVFEPTLGSESSSIVSTPSRLPERPGDITATPLLPPKGAL